MGQTSSKKYHHLLLELGGVHPVKSIDGFYIRDVSRTLILFSIGRLCGIYTY